MATSRISSLPALRRCALALLASGTFLVGACIEEEEPADGDPGADVGVGDTGSGDAGEDAAEDAEPGTDTLPDDTGSPDAADPVDGGGDGGDDPDPDTGDPDVTDPGEACEPVPEGTQCFAGTAGRVAGIYTRTSTGSADQLVRACDDGWGCSADRSTCATATCNPGASVICQDVLTSGLTRGRIVWKADLAGNTQQWPTLEDCPENEPICNPDGSLTCVSSVRDITSPWSSRSCPNADEIGNPTSLDTDCRCGINQVSASGLPQCQRVTVVYDRGEAFFGSGPRFPRNGTLRGGFIHTESRELIVANQWSDASGAYGILWGVDLDTGDRRILSGTFLDPSAGFARTTIGDGVDFTRPYHALEGPDGMVYVADNLRVGQVRVIRVDPATGDRELAWDSSDRDNWGWCEHRSPRASDQQQPAEDIRTRTFAMDAEGNFYFGNQQGGRNSGIAVLRISPDGQTCSDLTRSGATQSNGYVNNGTGTGYDVVQGDYSALSVQGDVMYAVNMVNNTLIAIDMATGNRRLISAASSSQRVGSGPTGRDGIPNYYTFADPLDDDHVWVVGDEGKTLMVRVQLSTGNRNPISPELNQPKWERFVHGPIFVGNLGAGGMWFDPEDPDRVYFAHDTRGIVVAEISTKNNRILSL